MTETKIEIEKTWDWRDFSASELPRELIESARPTIALTEPMQAAADHGFREGVLYIRDYCHIDELPYPAEDEPLGLRVSIGIWTDSGHMPLLLISSLADYLLHAECVDSLGHRSAEDAADSQNVMEDWAAYFDEQAAKIRAVMAALPGVGSIDKGGLHERLARSRKRRDHLR